MALINWKYRRRQSPGCPYQLCCAVRISVAKRSLGLRSLNPRWLKYRLKELNLLRESITKCELDAYLSRAHSCIVD